MNNIILIGHQSAGKTTLGKKIAERLRRPLLDTDELFGRPPNELYAELGEKAFRNVEKNIIRGLRNIQGHVIATGGGVPLDPENRQILRSMGRVIFINTPKDVLLQRKARFMEQYEDRLGIYTAMAHDSITTEDELWAVMRLDRFFGSPLGESRTGLPSVS